MRITSSDLSPLASPINVAGSTLQSFRPTVSPSAPQTTICANEPLILSGNPANGSGSYATHTWSGNTAPLSSTSVQNPTFITSTPGVYNLSYAVTDSYGCVSSGGAIAITVDPGFSVSLSSSDADNVICNGESVTFTASPTGAAAPVVYEFFVDGVSQGPASASNTFITSSLTNGQVVHVIADDNAGADCTPISNLIATSVNALPTDLNVTPAAISACSGGTVDVTIQI